MNMKQLRSKISRAIRSLAVMAICLPGLQAVGQNEVFTNIYGDDTLTFVTRTQGGVNLISGGRGELTVPCSVTHPRTHQVYNVVNVALLQSSASDNSKITSIDVPGCIKMVKIGHAVEHIVSQLTSAVLHEGVETIGSSGFSNHTNLSSVVIPESITTIEHSAFRNCSSLVTINLPSNLQELGARAFENCTSLTGIEFPSSLTIIRDLTFKGCTAIEELVLPNTIDSIYGYCYTLSYPLGAFAFSGLRKITLPSSLKYMGTPFIGCENLDTVIFNAINCYTGEFPSSERQMPALTAPNLKTLIIGDSVQRIPRYLASGTSLDTLRIPNSVKVIDYGAFKDCKNLKYLDLGTPDTIGENAFYGDSLESLTIPSSVKYSLGNFLLSTLRTFNYNAIDLEYFEFQNDNSYVRGDDTLVVNIGDSVRRIPMSFLRSAKNLRSINIPANVKIIGEYAFKKCLGLTEVNLSEGLDTIKYEAFYSTALENIKIPNTVRFIDSDAFSNCDSLRTITIGRNVDFINTRAFKFDSYNKKLDSLRCLASVPPVLGTSVFSTDTSSVLIVPCGSKPAYLASSWANYFSSEQIFEASSFDLNIESENPALGSVSAAYTDCEQVVLTATPEICSRFTAWNDGNTDNPRTITLSQDTTFIANFENIIYADTISQTINAGTSFNFNGRELTQTGTYTDTLQTLNGCDSLITLNLTVSSSLKESVSNEYSFKLSPNPAKNFVIVEFETLQENMPLQIFDIRGRKVKIVEAKAGEKQKRIELGDFAKGTYFIRLGNTTKKLIIE